jgi:hypothetical protein
MTKSEDFDLQGGSAAQGSGEKCAEGRQNRSWREPAQVSNFQLHPNLLDAQVSTLLYAAVVEWAAGAEQFDDTTILVLSME